MNEHTRAAVRAALDVAALGLIAVVCLLAAEFGTAPQPEPHRSYQRPATEQEMQQRRLMDDLTSAYQEGQR